MKPHLFYAFGLVAAWILGALWCEDSIVRALNSGPTIELKNGVKIRCEILE